MWFFILFLPLINCLPITVTVPEETSILTNQYCVENENITIYYANRKGIEEVNSDTFSSCLDLREIFLQENSIKILDASIFQSNNEVEAIYLDHNQLTTIEEGLFDNLTKLKRLTLASNHLKELPISVIKTLEKLEELYLHNNALVDLDERQLLLNLPNLREISLRNNQFNCERLEIILKSLKERNVTLNLLPRNLGQKLNVMSTRHGVECVESESSEEETPDEGGDDPHSEMHDHEDDVEEDDVEKILLEIKKLEDDVMDLKNVISQKSQLIERVYYLLIMTASSILVLIVVQFARH